MPDDNLGVLMDLYGYIAQWQGKEVVAFCGAAKYRGILTGTLEGGFLVLTQVAVIATGQEVSEYETCVLNVDELSGLVCEEFSGRGSEELI